MAHDELKRLLFGSDKSSDTTLMRVEVGCNNNASKVLEKAIEALTVILSVNSVCEGKEDWLTTESYEMLESWFTNNVLPDNNDDRLLDGIQNVRWFGEGRDWFWWSAQVADENTLYVYILVVGFPISGFDSLRWLLKCCGASVVEQGEAVKSSDL
ncbi:hypothetical protein A8B79_07775 [Balneola sp. EhC07]|uniref:hypothetical protein n=1 Tax=Balneola sp. EhC07 TaxID=1849360 RepID=UPI0007F43238|nr:hypothetical protein [Balneola sp. EhC07]OAN61349.1 hypothetical protein A8B79_07775 [Balneola sp. EhC07]